MTAVMIARITDDTTRTDLAETLALLNIEAKRLSRRGKVGTRSADYERQHERINAVLTEYQTCPTQP